MIKHAFLSHEYICACVLCFQVIKLKTLPLGVKCLVVACINFLLKSSLDNFIRAHIIAAKYGPKADVKTRGRDAKANKVCYHNPIEKTFLYLTSDMFNMFCTLTF